MHQLGTDTSGLKTALGKMVGTAQQLSGLFASDEVLKSGIADYAFEHYEIASYKMLIAAAGEAGEHQVEGILQGNLREEEEMAAWLAQHLPEVTREYLPRSRGADGESLTGDIANKDMAILGRNRAIQGWTWTEEQRKQMPALVRVAATQNQLIRNSTKPNAAAASVRGQRWEWHEQTCAT